MTPEGERLDQFLGAAISELSGEQQRESNMRGIERLANASGNLMKQADELADAAAAKLETAYAKHIAVAQRYEAFADHVSKKADDALDQLNQISNALPTPEASSDAEPSPEK